MKQKWIALGLACMMTLGLATACTPKQEAAAPTEAPAAATEAPKEEAPAATEAPAEAPAEAPVAEGAVQPGADGKYKVFLITMDQQDQHWVTVDAGAKKAAEELGDIDYQWLAPDVKDDTKQIESVNNAVAAGAQAILIAANGPDAITASLEEAKAAGVKIIYVDSPANLPALQTLATDNEAAGKTAGTTLIAALEAKGVTEGKVGIVGVSSSTASTVAREKGFRSAFEGSKFELLETQYGEGDIMKSKDIAANYLTQGCVALFGTNEGSTVGVGNAIQETGNAAIGVGFDKSDMILSLIKDGFLLAAMSQNPDVMGYEGVKSAEKALKGEALSPEYVDTGVSVITKDNLPQ